MSVKLWFRAPRRRLAGWLRAHLAGVAAGGLLVLAVASGLVLGFDTAGWGAAGQWAGAFGTVLAVIAAFRISQREFEHEAELRRAEQAERERELAREKAEREIELARLVVGVIEYPTTNEILYMENEYRAVAPWSVRITNFGPTHVFHPRVEGFTHSTSGRVQWDILTEFPGGYESAPAVLPPDPEKPDVIPVEVDYDPPIAPAFDPGTKPIIGYTDAVGRRWRRFGEGTPELVPADDTFEIGGPEWYRVDR